ncbi:MAG: alpha/beta hydrolase [Leucobacter sp.]|jgi:alpha-beta hydrolase superfamily lysophospholipase|nr:alpha/beta hydrolase [Leucobacter sp.]
MSTPAPQRSYTTFSYTDAHEIEISAYVWLPGATGRLNDTDVVASAERSNEPHAIVQIAHGVGEHALRYNAFAEVLAANGFVVYANDHRGHGETGRRQHGGDLTKLGKLGPGGLRAAEAAILQLRDIARERHPGLPVIMFGHSWGSLMTQRILNTESRPFDAVVLSGSAYRTPLAMESGELNQRWHGPEASGFEWLSRDPQTAADFIADELCFAADIAKLFGYADAIKLFGTPGRGVADVPMLIISGSEDPLSRGDGLRKLAAAYRARGVRDVTLRVFAGARHELLNETNRDEAIAAIVTWMLDRFTADDA